MKGSTLVGVAIMIVIIGAVTSLFRGPELTPAEQQAHHIAELQQQATETERKAKEEEERQWADYRHKTEEERRIMVSWCEPATGNRIYAQNYSDGVAVTQNDDSCPQPNPQLVGVERP